jgi:hypothetical protein
MTLKLLGSACLATLVLNPECATTPPSANVVAAPSQNVQPITADAGPANNYANGLFTSVTICATCNVHSVAPTPAEP